MTPREIDFEIATKIMGWKYEKSPYSYDSDEPVWFHPDIDALSVDDIEPPHYSTDISTAWLVVEKLIEEGWEISEAGYSMSQRKWDFTFGNGCSFPGPLCDTAPMAICLAALKTVE